ncbi:MAG: glycosyltransferase [bacterium]
MKTVLWTTHVYPRHESDMLGGFLHRLARELPPRGVRAVVVAPAADGAPEREFREGVEIRRFGYAAPGRQRLAYTGEMHRAALRRPLLAVRFFSAMHRAVRAAIEDVRPDVVHAHWWVPTAWVTSAETSKGAAPLVVSLHGTDMRLAGRLPGAAVLARRVLARAALALPVSEALAREMDRLRLGTSRREVLPMPADGDIFRPAEGPRAAAFVVAARLTRQKRVDLVIRALARLAGEGLEAALEIAGDGPESDALRARAAELGVTRQIRFLGVLSPADLAERFRSATAVILASEREGYGLSLVEGALCECVPVGARSGGIEDLVETEVSGLLFPPGDDAALTEAMARLVRDSALARRLGRTARERALTRTAAPLADRLVALYASVVRP